LMQALEAGADEALMPVISVDGRQIGAPPVRPWQMAMSTDLRAP
jgi:hypothetical protein